VDLSNEILETDSGEKKGLSQGAQSKPQRGSGSAINNHDEEAGHLSKNPEAEKGEKRHASQKRRPWSRVLQTGIGLLRPMCLDRKGRVPTGVVKAGRLVNWGGEGRRQSDTSLLPQSWGKGPAAGKGSPGVGAFRAFAFARGHNRGTGGGGGERLRRDEKVYGNARGRKVANGT